MRNSIPNGRRPATAGTQGKSVPGPVPEPEPGAGAAGVAAPGGGTGPAGEPLLRVVAGQPTPEELAALTAALSAKLAASAAAAAAAAARDRPAVSGWSDRARQLRVPLTPGPGAWRRSAWPG
jgi:hypothetical protein